MSTPKQLYQIRKVRRVPFPETPLQTEFSLEETVYQDGHFRGGQAIKNQFLLMRAKTRITFRNMNMLPHNQVEGFIKIYLYDETVLLLVANVMNNLVCYHEPI